MASKNETINVGVWVHPKSLKYCHENKLNEFIYDTPEPAALEFLLLTILDAGFKYVLTCIPGEISPLVENTTIMNGIFNLIMTGTMDTVGLLINYSEKRKENYSYSYPFSDATYTFVMKTKDLSPNEGALLLIRGITLEVWLTCLFTILLLTCTFAFIQLIHNDKFTENKCLSFLQMFSQKFWFIFRLMIEQAERGIHYNFQNKKKKVYSIYILFIFLSMLTVIMINLYQPVVYSQIAASARSRYIYKSKEIIYLIKQKQLTLITKYNESTYFDQVQYSNHEHFRLMRDALSHNPVVATNSLTRAAELLLDDDQYVLITSRRNALDLTKSQCSLQKIDLRVPSTYSSFIFNNNKSLTVLKHINDAILRLVGRYDTRSNMLMTSATANFLLRKKECDHSKRSELGLKPLGLTTLSGLFVLCSILAMVALMIFMVEKIWDGVKKKKVNSDTSNYDEKDLYWVKL